MVLEVRAHRGEHALTPGDYFGDSRLGREVYSAVHEALQQCGDVSVRTTKSQVTFRRRRGFAYIWLPGMYLSKPDAEVVLSIALDRRLDAERFKEIAHPSTFIWQHHLEVHDAADIDDELAGWLREACERAA